MTTPHAHDWRHPMTNKRSSLMLPASVGSDISAAGPLASPAIASSPSGTQIFGHNGSKQFFTGSVA